MGKKKITDVVAELAGDYLAENGYELYNTEFVKEGRDWFLRVYIDKLPVIDVPAETEDEAASESEVQAYISTEDCEKVSRFLSEKLDESDPIEQNYYLEVSSPGMDRPLITPEHYERYVGHEIEIKLYKAIDGVKNISGVLESFDKETGAVVVNSLEPVSTGKKGKKGGKKAEPESKRYELMFTDIAKANLAVVF